MSYLMICACDKIDGVIIYVTGIYKTEHKALVLHIYVNFPICTNVLLEDVVDLV